MSSIIFYEQRFQYSTDEEPLRKKRSFNISEILARTYNVVKHETLKQEPPVLSKTLGGVVFSGKIQVQNRGNLEFRDSSEPTLSPLTENKKIIGTLNLSQIKQGWTITLSEAKVNLIINLINSKADDLGLSLEVIDNGTGCVDDFPCEEYHFFTIRVQGDQGNVNKFESFLRSIIYS